MRGRTSGEQQSGGHERSEAKPFYPANPVRRRIRWVVGIHLHVSDHS
jgi:hypothetical protein